MQQALGRGLRPGIGRGNNGNTGIGHSRALWYRKRVSVQAFSEAPTATASRTVASAEELSPQQAQILQQQKGPLVKIATHYHVNFGDCLKVVGSSKEFGAWDAAAAPLMAWGEGDVWSVVLPLSPGDYEFKVVVQQGNGNLIWEAGDQNRVVSVPEEVPVGRMLVADCAFNVIDTEASAEVQPVTPDVLQLLEAQLAEQVAAEAEQAAVEEKDSRATQAAAAVAKALATMDAEAEENGLRVKNSSDDDESGELPSTAQLQEDDTSISNQLLEQAEEVDAAADAAEAAGEESEPQEVLAAVAAEEMAANLEVMSQEVHPSDDVASSTHAQASPAAAVHAKLARDKPVAVGFMDKPAPAPATSSVVAAFMQSVGRKTPSPVNDNLTAPAASAIADSAAIAAPATPESAVDTDDAAETAEPAKAVAPEAPPTVSTAAAADSIAAAIEQQQATVSSIADASASESATATTSAASGSTLPAATDAAAKRAAPLPKGWGPNAGASRFPARTAASSSSTTITGTDSAGSVPSAASRSSSSYGPAYGFGSSLHSSTSAGTPPNSPTRLNRPPSPGRGSSHVVSAAAAAAVAAEWIAGVRSNTVITAARQAEKAAEELAARLEQAQRKKSEAAAEAQRLHNTLQRSNLLQGVVAGNGNGNAAMAAAASAGYSGSLAAPRSKARSMAEAAMAASTIPLSPPPVTPASGAGLAAATSALAAAAAAGTGPSPPAVVGAPTSTKRTVSTQALSVSSSGGGAGAGTLTAGGAFEARAAGADVMQDGDDGGWGAGMQFLSAVVGCAAVGTVLWSEFVLKDTGCGLPPGPYGLLGAAEGLSYLAVLGFAGAGVSARVNSQGARGLPGALAVPETLAYGALAAGLMVLASQLYEYGYIPPPLPGGQCFADASVAMPGAEELNAQLAAQMAALQGILAQLQSAASDSINQLHLQEQLAILQAQVDAFSGYVSTQAAVLDSNIQVGLLQLQDSLSTATSAVSSFVDTQLQQLDLSGKLAYVLDILRTQEQALKVELPKQLAELQQLAATSMAVVQETALHASSAAHLPELLTSLDQVMAMLHDVLESRIQQLDVVLTQLQSSIGAAAGQLAAAVAAAEQAGSVEAAAQLQGLQHSLAAAMSDVQTQVAAGYQQLALADKLSDMLLTVRSSAAAVAASTASEVDKLRLQEQLQQLEGLAEASTAALAANAMEGINQLHLEQRLNDIATQAAAAATSLQAGLQQQYEQQLPAVEAQMSALQANLAELAAKTEQQLGERGPELESLLRQLQHSMESTMKLVGEVAATGVTAANEAVQAAGDAASNSLTAVNSQLGAASDAVSASVAVSFPEPAATVGFTDASNSMAALVQDSAPVSAVDTSAVTDAAAAVSAAVTDATSADAAAASSNLVASALPDGMEVLALPEDVVLEEADTYVKYGLDLSDASDSIKEIWANRPQ